jgi:NADPH:quinone reductase-like Zn-dependent oxidoreductase
MSGEVIAVGSSVRFLKVGDRVAASRVWDHVQGDFEAYMFYTISGHRCHGMLTEYKVLPEHGLVVVPDHLSWEEAACLPCSGVTAWSCITGPKPVKGGDYVVVQGTGGVAMFVVQFAAACGANVIVTSSSDEKLKIAESHGAQYLINYKTTPDWDEEVKKITNGAGAEHIIEIGGPGTLQKSVNCIAYGGYIHAVGFVASGDGENINITRLAMTKAFSLRGVFVGPATSFKSMNRLISARQLRPIVAKVFPYEETIAAYDYMTSHQHVGKVVIKVAKN